MRLNSEVPSSTPAKKISTTISFSPGLSPNIPARVSALEPCTGVSGWKRGRGRWCSFTAAPGGPRPAGYAAARPAHAAASTYEATPVPSASYAETGEAVAG